MHKLNLDETSTSSQPRVSTPFSQPQSVVDETRPTTHTINSLPMHSQKDSMARSSKLFPVIGLVAILAGVATGYGGYKLQAKSSPSGSGGESGIQQVAQEGSIKKGDVFGIEKDTFKDSAEGYLEAGGLDGEGSHKLLRPGGESQTVYLTSSVTDLDKFVGMEVKIMGETFKGQKVGWLMDVGRVEVVNPQGQAPTEEE